MNDITDEIKSEGVSGEKHQQTSAEIVVDGGSVATPSMVGINQTQDESLRHSNENDDNKGKDTDPPTEDDETSNTLKLLGEPLASQGPYTFYSALAYRKHSDVIKKKRRRWKNQKLQNVIGDGENATSAKSSDSSVCCCSDDSGNNLCTCDDGSLSCSLSTCTSEWSVVRMNHFYAVRPWYSIRNSSISDQQQKLQRRRRQRKNSPKLTSSASAERRQHHYQQSVCIGELELLWRDDSVVTSPAVSSSLLKKRNGNKVLLSSQTTVSNGTDAMPNNSNHGGGGTAVSSDDDDGLGGNDDDSSSLLPRRRTLPRRTRQPSAKKLEAAESYAAVAAAVVSDYHPLQQSPYHRSRMSTTASTDSSSVGVPLSSPSAQYKHGNVLCSVRLYVMPDQTAAGRLGGVHGEDEVLEINTWGSSGGGDRWSSNTFINGGSGVGSIYNGGGGGIDDYGYGSGSHSSGTLPSGCTGLVLRAEDFVEWVRGGLMNDEEYEGTESDIESLESECSNSINDQDLIKTEPSKKEEVQQSKLLPITTVVGDKVEQSKREKLDNRYDGEIVKEKTRNECPMLENVVKEENLTEHLKESEITKSVKVKEEQENTINLGKNDNNKIIKGEHDDNKIFCSKSAIDEALEAECVPLAAARIHPRQGDITHHHHCHQPKSESLVNGDNSLKQDHLHNERMTMIKVDDNNDDKRCNNCKRRRRSCQYNENKTKNYKSSSNEQRLVVMSYSRYCRYRAQLQRKREEQLKVIDTTIGQDDNNETGVTSINRGVDKSNTTRVLFCRDTYDYPAELLLEPFNAQHGQQQNTSVLVNHMAPKLKGWPAYPASWMSFRWNRVRRRLRHLEHGNNGNEDRRRRRRRKLKIKCRQRQNGAAMVMSYSSSTEDDDSDDSDSDEASSATNDGATNTTSTTSTSDSDGAPPVSSVVSKTSNKNQSIVTTKVNGGIQQSNKKTLSATAASNMIITNGTTESTNTINKRPAAATGPTGQQQPTKRRRVEYAIGGQPQNQQNQLQRQRIIYQQQNSKQKQLLQQQQLNQRSRQSEQFNQINQAQRNHHHLVQQQHRFQSLNRRLPTPISSIQSSTTRVIHHHLPPSVTIMPVIVPSTSTAAHHQQQRDSNRLPNRQIKQYSPATISATQRQNNNSKQQSNSLPPVIIEYDDDENQEYVSDDNGRYTNTTVAKVMAACQRRVERQSYEDEQRQQREDEERQRRWLVDALRLGGLEVTAVPLKGNTSGNSSDVKDTGTATAVTSQQQRRRRQLRQRGVSIESLPLETDHNNSGVVVQNERGDDDSNIDSDSDSVVMTVTPDVICILNKSQQQMQLESHEDNSSSTSLGTTAHSQPQQRRPINMSNNNNNSGRLQHPVGVSAEAGAVLHDKINRAIDSLKQQQQTLKNDVPVSNNSNNVLVLGGSSQQYSNNNNNRQQQQRLSKNSGFIGFRNQPTSTIIDRSVQKLGVSNSTITTTAKQLKHISQSSTVNSNIQPNQLQQLRKVQSPFSSITMASTASANLEITLVPVTASSNTNSTKLISQQHQKRNSPLAAPNNVVGVSEILPVTCSSSSMSVKQLRRNAVVTNISSTPITDNSNKSRHQQQRVSSGISVTPKASSQQQQQKQILIMTTSSVTGPQSEQQLQIDKRKPQQNKKD